MSSIKERIAAGEFAAVNQAIGQQAADIQTHLDALLREHKTHSGHTYSRHGYQSGWESQVIRACTKLTPDQGGFDPMGLAPTLQSWRATDPELGPEFPLVTKIYAPAAFGPGGLQGQAAGGFFNPSVHQRVIARVNAVIAGLWAMEQAECRVQNVLTFKPLDKISIVVSSEKQGYGLGFQPNVEGNGWRRKTRGEVMASITAYQVRVTLGELLILAGRSHGPLARHIPTEQADWKALMVGLTTAKVKRHVTEIHPKLRNQDGSAKITSTMETVSKSEASQDTVLIANFDELMEYLQLKYWTQKRAVAFARRNGMFWSLITCYPSGAPAHPSDGWCPSWHNNNGQVWTGRLATVSHNSGKLVISSKTHLVPLWKG